jgi:hypothetical protein
VEAIILAAKRLGIAGGSRANANDGDGGAGSTDEDGEVLDNDANYTKGGGDGWGVRGAISIAALDGAGGALGSGDGVPGKGTI